MWIVRWCSHEGNLCERRFKALRGALAEAKYLRKTHEYVKITHEGG